MAFYLREFVLEDKHAQLFSIFRADMLNDFGGNFLQQLLDSHQQQKYHSKAAYEATEVMLSSIVRAKLLADARLGKASTACSSLLSPEESTASVSPEAFLRDATSVLLMDSNVTELVGRRGRGLKKKIIIIKSWLKGFSTTLIVAHRTMRTPRR
jgi:hypothetical protein